MVEALLAATEVMEIEQPSRHPSRPFDWRTPFLDCLIQGELPEDRAEARRIARRAKSYVIYSESKELYRRSPTGILQHCITVEEGQKLLEDLHSGLAATTWLPEPSSATPFDKASTGQRPSLRPSSLFVRATGANSTPSKPTSQLTLYR